MTRLHALRQSIMDALAPRAAAARRVAWTVFRNPLAVLGAVLVLAYVILAVGAPWFAPPDPLQQDPHLQPVDQGAEYKEPGWGGHLLGTSKNGIDIWYGIVWGARLSMTMGLSVTLVALVIGTLVGAVAGFVGGRLDDLIMRLTDVFLALPLLIIAMAVVVALGPSLEHIAYALILAWWPPYTRIVRGQVLLTREAPYVEAARASGASEARILFRHVLPNSLSPLIVQATLDIGMVVLVAASLAFIGFAPGGPLLTEWGTLVSIGQERLITGAWWAATFPGLAILGFVLAFNLLGDALRDALDPRSRKG